MRFISILLFSLSLTYSLFAQQPLQKKLGSDLIEVSTHFNKLSNGYLATGYSVNYGYDSLWGRFVKLDTNFNLLWQKTYTGLPHTNIQHALQLKNGSFILSGRSSNNANNAPRQGGLIVKTDSLGQPVWTRTVKSTPYETIFQSFEKNNGDIISLANEPTSSGVTRFNTEGVFQNAYRVNNIRLDKLIQQSNNTMLGFGTIPYSYTQQYIIQYNDENTLPKANWAYQYEAANRSFFQIISMATDNNQNIYIAGSVRVEGTREDHVLIAKLSPTGDVVWAEDLLSNDSNINFSAINITPLETGVAIVGYANNAFDSSWGVEIKLNNQGSIVWSKSLTEGKSGYLRAAIKNNQNGLDIFGTSSINVANNYSKFYFVRTDSLGNGGKCYTDTLTFQVLPATLNKTVYTPTFSNISYTVYEDPIKTTSSYPLTMSYLCGQPPCTPPTAPNLLVGGTTCTSNISVKETPVLRWSKTASLYNVYVSGYPFDKSIWSASCVSDTFIKPNFSMQEGQVYRWYVEAVNGTCEKAECVSTTQSYKYFSKSFSIFPRDTAYTCKDGVVNLSSNVIGQNEWYKNDKINPDIYSSLYQTNEAGTYKLKVKSITNDSICKSLNFESLPVFIKNDSTTSFNITIKPSVQTFCPGSSIKLTAQGSPSKSYQWTGNRLFATLAQQGDSVATVNIPTDASGTYTFFISSSYLECAVSIKTEFTISSSASPTLSTEVVKNCINNTIQLKATATNEGTNPTFKWYLNKDTTSIGSGKTLDYNTTKEGDKITCRLTLGEGSCSNIRSVTSDTVNITKCIISGVNEISGLKEFILFPNPSSREFDISFQYDKINNVSINIKNYLGQTIYTKTTKNSSPYFKESINLEKQPKGFYWVETWIDNQVIVNKIFIN